MFERERELKNKKNDVVAQIRNESRCTRGIERERERDFDQKKIINIHIFKNSTF